MANLAEYLMGRPIKDKKKKKRRKVRWGSSMGKVNDRRNRREDSNIEKLLMLLVARSTPTPAADLQRQQEIQKDFGLAAQLQQQEFMKAKKVDDDLPSTEDIKKDISPIQPIQSEITETPITGADRENKFQSYQLAYDNLEQDYKGLIGFIDEHIGGPEAVLRREYMDEAIARREQLNNQRNILRKDLLQDIANNPQDVWEWQGFIENSEVRTSDLLDLDNTVNSILYDQARRNLENRELLTAEKIKLAEENELLMKKQLEDTEIQREREKAFNEELKTEALKTSQALARVEQEKTIAEAKTAELDEMQKFLSKRIAETFDKGKKTLQERYIEGADRDFAKSSDFQRALGETGLTEDWDRITGKVGYRTVGKPEDRKRELNRKLLEKIKEQEQFLPKKVEGIMGALPRSPSLTRTASGSSVGSGAGLSPRRTVSGENLLNVLRATQGVIEQSSAQPQLTPPTTGGPSRVEVSPSQNGSSDDY
jgi:hypothetical protein